MKSVTHKLFNVPAGRYGLTELAKLLGEEPSVILGRKLSKLRGRVIGKNTLAIDAAGRFREFIFEPNVRSLAGEALPADPCSILFYSCGFKKIMNPLIVFVIDSPCDL